MSSRRSRENGPGTWRTTLLVAVAAALMMPAAAAVHDGGTEEVIRVVPEEGADTMTVELVAPLQGDEVGAAGPASTCTGTATGSCTGSTWQMHCCSLSFETTVFIGTLGETTNRVTGLNGPSNGNAWEVHCQWLAVTGLCFLHQHGGLFVGDDARHTGSADYDLCVPGLCDWTHKVTNVH